jgi:NAD(P)-dependent dehydrogenase (short-subunit alcohol dehydrogenase family)
VGCREPNVGVRLVFPAELTFLATATARVDVYDGGDSGERSPDAICRSLSVTPPTPPDGVKPLATSGSTDVCLFRAGGVLLEQIGAKHRLLHVLVNNSGTNWAEPLESYSLRAWRKVMDLNVDAVFALTWDRFREFQAASRADASARSSAASRCAPVLAAVMPSSLFSVASSSRFAAARSLRTTWATCSWYATRTASEEASAETWRSS